jgi:hypothetical protein
MIALLASLLALGVAQDKPTPAPDADVACVDLITFAIQNSEFDRAIVAEGSILNRTPWELTNVSIEIVIIGDNKFPLGTMPREAVAKIGARKGAGFIVKGVTVPLATRFTHKIVVRYTIEGQDRSQLWENLQSKSPKIYVDPEAGPKVGVMGFRTVGGAYKSVNKQQQYTGDTIFLRLRIDGFDDKIKPEGQLEVTITADGKKMSPVRRSITGSALKTDISKVPGSDPDPKSIGYDGVNKDIYVGLLKVDNVSKLGKILLEVKFSGAGGTWTWTALEEPHLGALRPPDTK